MRMPLQKHRDAMEDLYRRYNRMEYVHPDPLEFVHRYADSPDREVVALVAACLAYGRVAQILKSVAAVLDRLGPHPAEYLRGADQADLRRQLASFRHRFASGQNLSALLLAARRAILDFGSLRGCFEAGMKDSDETVLPALSSFVRRLRGASGGACGHLLPAVEKGSACKRLNLLLRWMVRRDAVDPGGWDEVSPSRLLVPLDTHMHRLGLAMGLTRRRSADMRTVMEVTAAFKRISPDDPVRYDFVLTRPGIHGRRDVRAFLAGREGL